MLVDDYLNYQTEYENKYGKNTIVLMEVGHFFEFYAVENDIENIGNIHNVSELLNIQVTRKNKSIKTVNRSNPLMAGFPSLALKKHQNMLINHGYTVILVEQITPPPNPKRGVTNILSPGTYIEESTGYDYNNIVSIYIQKETCYKTNKKLNIIGLSVIDLTTGRSSIYEAISNPKDRDYSIEETIRFIQTYNPREIIISCKDIKDVEIDNLIMSFELNNRIYYIRNDLLIKDIYKPNYQNKFLAKSFPNIGFLTPIEYLCLENKPCALISYMVLLQFSYEHNETIINKIRKPNFWENQRYLILENNAIQQLNLVPNTHSSKYDSLYSVINNTSTAIGKRYLKDRLLMPIIDDKELQKRYDLIEIFMSSIDSKFHVYQQIELIISGIIDIERLHRKMDLQMLNPAEFYQLHISYDKINQLIEYINNYSNDKVKDILPNIEEINLYNKYQEEYNEKFVIDDLQKYNINDITNSFFKKGYYPDVDQTQFELNKSKRYLKCFAEKLHDMVALHTNGCNANHTDMAKVESNERDGYYITITKKRFDTLKSKVKIISFGTDDKEWSVKLEDIKTIVNASNYKLTNSEMKEYSKIIIEKTELIKTLCRQAYLDTLTDFNDKYQNVLYKITCFIANIDVIKSSAKTSLMYNYCKPIINTETDESYIKAEDARHPIIERINKTEYIPNWIRLGTILENDKCIENSLMNGMLLFGCNSLGKSSYMKSVGLCVILAQMGMYVPASRFEYKPFKTLLTRIIGNDNMFKGLSSFAVEMSELRGILNRADKNSLVLGDEICHGTEQTSGIAIVSASLIWLHKQRTKFIFATHLHNLSNIDEIRDLSNIKKFHLEVSYDNNQDRLIYKRKLMEGSGSAIYGLEIARAMDLDRDFINLANNIRKKFIGMSEKILTTKTSRYNSELYFKSCEVCGNEGIDTHHIKFQSSADENGFVDHRNKNHYSNLVILCKECHNKVHHDKLKINGYLQTSDGIILDYS